ncbi:hypothetical protein CBFG_03024 [Clostridiales bacterium 1_7_47FAA]|nr:hypothetical protein CBFG_03024 [Clostridiales bacterium 1_7_47FAA]
MRRGPCGAVPDIQTFTRHPFCDMDIFNKYYKQETCRMLYGMIVMDLNAFWAAFLGNYPIYG